MLERSGLLPTELVYKIVLENLQQRFGAEMLPELAVSSGFSFVFSHQPAFTDDDVPGIVELFAAYEIDIASSPRPFLLIDSIDEIHPASAKLLIREIEKDVDDFSISPFIHVFIVGRAEGFRGFFTDPHGEIKIPPPIGLELPGYVSIQDMEIGVASSAEYFRRESAVEPLMALIQRYDFIEESCFIQSLRGDFVKRAEEYAANDVSPMKIKADLF